MTVKASKQKHWNISNEKSEAKKREESNFKKQEHHFKQNKNSAKIGTANKIAKSNKSLT